MQITYSRRHLESRVSLLGVLSVSSSHVSPWLRPCRWRTSTKPSVAWWEPLGELRLLLSHGFTDRCLCMVKIVFNSIIFYMYYMVVYVDLVDVSLVCRRFNGMLLCRRSSRSIIIVLIICKMVSTVFWSLTGGGLLLIVLNMSKLSNFGRTKLEPYPNALRFNQGRLGITQSCFQPGYWPFVSRFVCVCTSMILPSLVMCTALLLVCKTCGVLRKGVKQDKRMAGVLLFRHALGSCKKVTVFFLDQALIRVSGLIFELCRCQPANQGYGQAFWAPNEMAKHWELRQFEFPLQTTFWLSMYWQHFGV